MSVNVTILPFDESSDDIKVSFSVISRIKSLPFNIDTADEDDRNYIVNALDALDADPSILAEKLTELDSIGFKKHLALDLNEDSKHSLLGEISDSKNTLKFMYSGISANDEITITEKEKGKFYSSVVHQDNDNRGDCIVMCPSSGESAPGCLECRVGDLWIEVCC
jgi:hypothetical protein